MFERGIAVHVSTSQFDFFDNVPVIGIKLDTKGHTIGIALIRGIMVEVRQSSKDWRNWKVIDERYEELEDTEVKHALTSWGEEEDLVNVVCELKALYHELSMPVEHWRIPFAKSSVKHQKMCKITSDGNRISISSNETVHITHTDDKGREYGYCTLGNALYKLVRADDGTWLF